MNERTFDQFLAEQLLDPEVRRAYDEQARIYARADRRMRGYHPETPARSAMHTAYRAKTRRRNRR